MATGKQTHFDQPRTVRNSRKWCSGSRPKLSIDIQHYRPDCRRFDPIL